MSTDKILLDLALVANVSTNVSISVLIYGPSFLTLGLLRSVLNT